PGIPEGSAARGPVRRAAPAGVTRGPVDHRPDDQRRRRLGDAPLTLRASSLDDVGFRALYEREHLIALRLGNLKGVERRAEVADERGPVRFADAHPAVRRLHVSSRVVEGTPGARTQEI